MSKIDWSKAPKGTTGAMVAHFDGDTTRRGDVEFIPSAGEREIYGEGPDAWVYHPMPKPFEREERYIVVKIKDAQAIDKDDPFNGEDHLRAFLKQSNIPTREGLVIEKDWPEYEPTWAAIERRMTGAPAWVGVGPPPAGTLCEIRNVAPGTDWAEATIVFASRNVVVWDWVGEPTINGLCTAYAHAVEMRPVRTPEQIAAEEREKAIAEMVSTSPMLDKGWARKVCTALYDAGYRKQVAP